MGGHESVVLHDVLDVVDERLLRADRSLREAASQPQTKAERHRRQPRVDHGQEEEREREDHDHDG